MDENQSEFLLYETEDGQLKIETRIQDETVWLTQKQMADLFGKASSTINEHIRNIFREGELVEERTIRKFRIVQKEGSRSVSREVDFYNLDVIISVGYRVKSHRGTQFRIWATQRLREYIVKGFTMNDELLKQAGGGNYFDELLERIRDIRSSEKVFWRKVLDIYATSIDYDPKSEESRQFFAQIQNKMHWAAHGHTAAEIIYQRVDSQDRNLGMTNWTGDRIKKSEVSIAKNYLKKDELELLNRIVTAYLEMAELQAFNRQPMYMKDWIERLDMFLKMTGRELLDHVGEVSHNEAYDKALKAYEKYRTRRLNEPTEVEKHFIEAEQLLKLDLKNPTDKND